MKRLLIKTLFRPGAASQDDADTLMLDGLAEPVHVRRSTRAKRLTLRVSHRLGGVELVIPRRVSRKKAAEFARKYVDWIAERQSAVPDRVVFEHGAVIPVFGADHEIIHAADAPLRGLVRRHEGRVHVPGLPEHLPRRLTDYLKKETRAVITGLADEKAAMIDKRITGVSLRDPRTRWGSCSSEGRLSFSWRLVFAPEHVLDYVVAHEVAHLEHMDHSKDFWRLCASLCSDYHAGRAWLKHNGASLHRFGQARP